MTDADARRERLFFWLTAIVLLFAGLGLGRVGRIRDFVRGAALGVLGLEPRDVCA